MDPREEEAWETAATIINGHILTFRSEENPLSVEGYDEMLTSIVKGMSNDKERGLDRLVLLLNALAFYVADALHALGYESAEEQMKVIAEVNEGIKESRGQDD